jgi:serine/threonine protein kinase
VSARRRLYSLHRSDPSHLISALKISPGGDGPPTPDPTPTPPHAADESVEEFDSVLALDSLDLSDKRIDPSKIERGDKIGSGGYKDVYRGKYGRFRVAVSVLRGRLTKEDVKELGLLRDFKHPNVIRFIGVCIEPDCMSIVTEIAMNGDLFHYLRTVPCPAFLAQLELMLGSARGLLYLHNRLVVHRDIKSLNILVSSRGVAKLNDFGLSKVKSTIASM